MIPSAETRSGMSFESESNNTMATADRTYDDYDSYGVLSSESDVDWWKVEFDQDGQANFWLGDIPTGCDYDIFLYDEDCLGTEIDWLAESYNSGQTAELIQWNVEAGVDYYVKIVSYEGASPTSEYLFRAKNTPSVPETEAPEIVPEPEEPTFTY